VGDTASSASSLASTGSNASVVGAGSEVSTVAAAASFSWVAAAASCRISTVGVTRGVVTVVLEVLSFASLVSVVSAVLQLGGFAAIPHLVVAYYAKIFRCNREKLRSI